MSRFRVYLKTFDELGAYESDFTEITEDVIALSNIKQQLDGSDYDVGVYRNDSFKIKLRNDHGHYSPPSQITSVFPFKRNESIVKVTWDARDTDLYAGFFLAGDEVLGLEVEVFRGLLEDATGSTHVQEQNIEFMVLGFESLLGKTEVPFADIDNGDLLSAAMFTAINSNRINQLVTVAQSNIVVGSDQTLDDKTDIETQTIAELLEETLLISGSVLYIKDSVLHVKNRDESAADVFEFYGQASDNGIENIIDIKGLRSGVNRTFNFWTWTDTALSSQDATSIQKFGIKKKEIDFSPITDTVKRQALLDYNRTEFKDPKIELELTTPITYAALELFLLDQVSIDYPTIYIPADDKPLPRYGFARYGEARYPYELWPVTISQDDRFKITSRSINTDKHLLTFGLREI